MVVSLEWKRQNCVLVCQSSRWGILLCVRWVHFCQIKLPLKQNNTLCTTFWPVSVYIKQRHRKMIFSATMHLQQKQLEVLLKSNLLYKSWVWSWARESARQHCGDDKDWRHIVLFEWWLFLQPQKHKYGYNSNMYMVSNTKTPKKHIWQCVNLEVGFGSLSTILRPGWETPLKCPTVLTVFVDDIESVRLCSCR